MGDGDGILRGNCAGGCVERAVDTRHCGGSVLNDFGMRVGSKVGNSDGEGERKFSSDVEGPRVE